MSLITDQFRVNKAYSGNRDEIRWKDADTLEWTRTRALLTERRPSEPMNRNVQTETTTNTYRLSEANVLDPEHRPKSTSPEDMENYKKISRKAEAHVNTLLSQNYDPPDESKDQKVDVAFSASKSPKGKYSRDIGHVYMSDKTKGTIDIGGDLIEKGFAAHQVYTSLNNSMRHSYELAQDRAKVAGRSGRSFNLWSFRKK